MRHAVSSRFHSHHVFYFARNLAAHRDGRNRVVHLVATVVGFGCLVAMLARVSLGALDLGALLALASFVYFVPFEPLAATIVGGAVLAERLVLGAHFGQAGVGPVVGLGVPLGIFLVFNLSGVATHFLFDDPIIASGSREPMAVRLAKTAHTIAFSSVHFVGFALFELGYRRALRAEIVTAAQRQAEAWHEAPAAIAS